MDLKTLLFFTTAASTFLAFTVSLSYLWRHHINGILDWLTASVFAFIGYNYLILYLTQNGAILSFPHLFRTGAIASFSILPVMYLIISKRIRQKDFKWIDTLHFLPVLIFIINFFPFFIQPAPVKIEIISEHLSNENILTFDEGWFLTGNQLFLMRIAQAIIYFILTFYILQQKNWLKQVQLPYKLMIYWFMLYMLNFFLIYIFNLIGFGFQNKPLIVSLGYSILTILFLVYFFVRPEMVFADELYRTPPQGATDELQSEEWKHAEDLTLQNHWLRIGKIDHYLMQNKMFLQAELSLQQLEKELGISTKLISKTIKEKYHLSFTQYINKLRIDFVVKKLIEDPGCRAHSIEDLSLKGGFNNTNSFYKHFKYFTGKTPREFIEGL